MSFVERMNLLQVSLGTDRQDRQMDRQTEQLHYPRCTLVPRAVMAQINLTHPISCNVKRPLTSGEVFSHGSH